jgi:hypothetical protein
MQGNDWTKRKDGCTSAPEGKMVVHFPPSLLLLRVDQIIQQ